MPFVYLGPCSQVPMGVGPVSSFSPLFHSIPHTLFFLFFSHVKCASANLCGFFLSFLWLNHSPSRNLGGLPFLLLLPDLILLMLLYKTLSLTSLANNEHFHLCSFLLSFPLFFLTHAFIYISCY